MKTVSQQTQLPEAGGARDGRRGWRNDACAPDVNAQTPIKWRLQTYAGPALGRARDQELDRHGSTRPPMARWRSSSTTADQLVPHGELFRAVQAGTIDAAQSDDDSAAAPVDVKVFGAYFPFASRYSLDVPALWHWHGLKEIWEEAYAEGPGASPGCQHRLVGPVQLRHHQADPLARRPAGPARLHLPDRRPVPCAVRRRAGVAALRGRAAGDADRRTRRRRWSRHHRDAHGRLGGRH